MVLSVPVGRNMPHKTKKEKIIADLHRKIYIQKGQKISSSEILEPDISIKKDHSIKKTSDNFSYTFESLNQGKNTKIATYNTIVIDSSEYKYIVSDLRKTFILTIIVLLIEIMLYWALELGGIKI